MGLSLQKALRLLNHTKLCPNQPAYPHQQSQQLVHHVVSVIHQLRWDNSVRNPSHCGTRKGIQGQGRHPEHAGTLQPDASPSPIDLSTSFHFSSSPLHFSFSFLTPLSRSALPLLLFLSQGPPSVVNSPSCCRSLLSAGITGMDHPAWFSHLKCKLLFQKIFFFRSSMLTINLNATVY